MAETEGYGRLIFVLIASFLLDLLLISAITDIVDMKWGPAVIIGVVVYIILVAVLTVIAEKLMP